MSNRPNADSGTTPFVCLLLVSGVVESFGAEWLGDNPAIAGLPGLNGLYPLSAQPFPAASQGGSDEERELNTAP